MDKECALLKLHDEFRQFVRLACSLRGGRLLPTACSEYFRCATHRLDADCVLNHEWRVRFNNFE
eukprot:2953398-Amphidinium_carterae.1